MESKNCKICGRDISHYLFGICEDCKIVNFDGNHPSELNAVAYINASPSKGNILSFFIRQNNLSPMEVIAFNQSKILLSFMVFEEFIVFYLKSGSLLLELLYHYRLSTECLPILDDTIDINVAIVLVEAQTNAIKGLRILKPTAQHQIALHKQLRVQRASTHPIKDSLVQKAYHDFFPNVYYGYENGDMLVRDFLTDLHLADPYVAIGDFKQYYQTDEKIWGNAKKWEFNS